MRFGLASKIKRSKGDVLQKQKLKKEISKGEAIETRALRFKMRYTEKSRWRYSSKRIASYTCP